MNKVTNFKRGDFLQSTVEHGCVVEFYEWADKTETAFHGHLISVREHGMVRIDWADNWNGDVFEQYVEAPMQLHLEWHHVRKAVGQFILCNLGVEARNIQFDTVNGLVTYETY